LDSLGKRKSNLHTSNPFYFADDSKTRTKSDPSSLHLDGKLPFDSYNLEDEENLKFDKTVTEPEEEEEIDEDDEREGFREAYEDFTTIGKESLFLL